MKKTTALIILGIIALMPLALTTFFIVTLYCHDPCVFSRWLGFAYCALAAPIVLFAVWMIYHSYLKLVEIENKRQIEQEKLKQEKELTESHNKFRTATDSHDYQLRMEAVQNENLLKSEAARNEILLKLVDKLSDRKEIMKKGKDEEVKTISVSFQKKLLDELKEVKLKWDEIG